MFQSCMHEHIGYNLVYPKVTGQEKVQPQKVFQINSIQTGDISGGKGQHIYNKQILSNGRHCIHKSENCVYLVAKVIIFNH